MSTGTNTEKWSISAGWVFRGTEYTVCADVRDDILVVQVEDKLTADRWRGQFDAKHIEELTRKTGNFKQFSIFLNMLESAITKSSDSVALDLLTYADLETLRKTKLGSGSVSGRGFTPGKNKVSHAKRYLILTYSVEFDRIHYPLALPYCGPPDPAVLQETIKRLLADLEKAKKQGHNHFAFARLQREDMMLYFREKEELEEAFESFKQDMMLTQQGAVSKEMRILKKVIKNLEEELLKERTKHQKYTSKRNEEFKLLLQELDGLRSSERALRCRVKSLTNELAILKTNIRNSPYHTPVSLPSGSSSRNRAGSNQRPMARERQRSTSRDRNKVGTRRRSISNERQGSQTKLRTPSPGVGRMSRFDPTAYVERKRQRQQEINSRLGRGKLPCSRTNSTENLLRPPKPVSSAERRRPTYRLSSSRCSSRGSSRGSSRRSSVDLASDAETWYGQAKSVTRGQKTRQVWGSSPRNASTPAEAKGRTGTRQNDPALLDHSTEISEIDARLNALQEFMKRSMETARSSSKR